jgi:hypothetical protein
MKIFTLLETQYYDFTQAIKKYLSKNLPDYGTVYGSNTVFGQLINVLSSAIQNIMLYIEDALTEQNKYTAQRKKSIYGLASQSGYNPFLGKASNIQLKICFKPNNSNKANVIINNKEPITCSKNGMVYNLILPQETIIYSPERDNVVRYCSAVQGKFEKQTFISTGGKYYTQNIKFVGNLDVDYLDVKVNNELWEFRDSIYDMDPDGKQFTRKVSITGGLDLIFGNDKFGRALKENDVIEIHYLLHDGEAGNFEIGPDAIFVFNNKLTDVNGDELDGNSIFNINLANLDSVTSGSNSESLEQVRDLIGYNSRSLILSDANHYKRFIKRFSFCGYNRTWSENGSMIVNSLIMKNYKLLLANGKDYFSLKESDFLLSDLQKKSIRDCVENSGMQLAGTAYNIFEPELCKYAAHIYVTLKNNNKENNYITNQIRDLIGSFFSDIQSDIFIPKSDIVHLLKNNIDEIDSVDVYFISERNEKAIQRKQYKSTTYKYSVTDGVYKKHTETVKLYDGENPNLGLDNHGNIYLNNNHQFPVLMGGWDFINKNEDTMEVQEVTVVDPLIIIYE